VRYQDSRGRFTRHRVFDVEHPAGWPGTLLITDLDGDRRNDLAVLTEEALLIYSQNRDGELTGPRSYAVADDDAYGLQAIDIDRDGRRDLLYQVAQSPDALRVRFGIAAGGFGAEVPFRIEPTRGGLEPVVLGNDGMPRFVRIQAVSGSLELLELDRADTAKTWLKKIRPRLFSSRTDAKNPASYAVDDFDGDGRPDIAIADGRGARTWLLLQHQAGEFAEAAEFPSLADVRSLASGDLDGDGRAELFLASPKDRTVAWTTLGGSGRLGYPMPLPTRGKPFAVAAHDLDGDGDLEVAYAFSDQRQTGVQVLDRDGGGEEWRHSEIVLEAFDSPPNGLRIVDANHDGRSDLAVFGTREGLRLLLQSDDGSFAETSLATGFRQGLVDGVEPSAMTTGDVTGDGRDEILVATDGYARSLTVTADGDLEVVDQYNARSSDTPIAAAVVADLDGDAVPEVVLVEKGEGRLQVLKRRRDGVYRHVETAAIGDIDLVEARVVDLAGDGVAGILLFGADRFAWLPVGSADMDMIGLSTHESDLFNVVYDRIAVGDLDSDGRSDVVAVDARDSHVLEVLEIGDDNRWTSVLHFTIFDVDPHYEGQRGTTAEPREVVVADVTGDGRDDVVLLVHDRVLVYPQQ